MTLLSEVSNVEGTNVVCHECDCHVRLPQLAHRQKAKCPRCGFVLTRHNEQYIERILAFGLAGLVFLVLSMPFEFLGFSANGQAQSIGIISGLGVLVEQDYLTLAIIQFVSIVIIPALVLICLCAVALSIQGYISRKLASKLLSILFGLLPWSMAEIFIIGVLVSLIKISSLADVSLGHSFFAYIGFVICLVSCVLHADRHKLFMAINGQPQQHKHCSPSESIQRTWALLMTSILLYIPANALPIMHTRFLGNDEPSTILGGVILLWQAGSYPIAAVIFVASVIVPVGKLVILIWLNFTVQKGVYDKHSERIFWYRVTEFIGRWSMVDVFVVAILVSLIQLGNAMSIYPGPAALAFCGVVVFTMLAAMTFDSRLIWRGSVNDQ